MDTGDTTAEAVVPLPQPGRARGRVLFGSLGLFVLLWIATEYRQRGLEGSVAELVQRQIKELHEPGLEYASEFSATRDLLLVGTPRARVEIFMRNPLREASILGVAYYFAQENGEWQLVESAGCTDKECATRGRAAFAKMD